MRALITLVFVVSSATAASANAVAVPNGKGYCDTLACHEWVLLADRSIRIVYWTDGDDDFTRIYRVDKRGKYLQIAEVTPVLEDSSRPGVLFVGFGEDIRDVVMTRIGNAIAVRGTYKSNAVPDAEIGGAKTKTATHLMPLPYVLFTGRTTQPDFRIQDAVEWRSITLDELAANDDKRVNDELRTADEELRKAKEALKKR